MGSRRLCQEPVLSRSGFIHGPGRNVKPPVDGSLSESGYSGARKGPDLPMRGRHPCGPHLCQRPRDHAVDHEARQPAIQKQKPLYGILKRPLRNLGKWGREGLQPYGQGSAGPRRDQGRKRCCSSHRGKEAPLLVCPSAARRVIRWRNFMGASQHIE